MLGHVGPCWTDLGRMLGLCEAYVWPRWDLCSATCQILAHVQKRGKHRVLEQKRGHPPCWSLYWDMLGSVWHMLGYVGPILGLCRAYVEPIEPILRPILSQENHV